MATKIIYLNVDEQYINSRKQNRRSKTMIEPSASPSLKLEWLQISIHRTSEYLNVRLIWNGTFLHCSIFQYKCCGVNKVVGTTNDFDSTSWCTTSGTCQVTASQIPKTCCKGFTKYDYQNAPTECHSSVNPGEYYEKVKILKYNAL